MSNKSLQFRVLSVWAIKSLVLQNKETEPVICYCPLFVTLRCVRTNLHFKRNSVFEIYIKSNLNIVLS